MAYAEQEGPGRGWVVYLPPHPMAGSPLLSAPVTTALSPDFMIANFRAWHARNGGVWPTLVSALW